MQKIVNFLQHNRGISIGFGALLLVIVAVFYYFNSQVKEEKIISVLDQCTLALENKLRKERMRALEIALALSKNQGLIDALINEQEENGYERLYDITRSIQDNTSRYIRAQIITHKYTIFARSWDDMYAGMPLEDYRQDLRHVKAIGKPRTSLEVGRRLGIKATVPVYHEGKLLGFFEVIEFFESITDYFRAMGIDLYVLLDYSYFDRAILMQENLVLHNHILSNINYNFGNIQTLKELDYKELQANRIVYQDKKYIFYETMYDGKHEAIGGFVFVLPQKYLDYFRNPEDDISFLINVTRSGLYDVVRAGMLDKNEYYKYQAETLLYFKEIMAREDKELFFDEVYKKLDTYSKDELIQLMLEYKMVKKIDGKIR